LCYNNHPHYDLYCQLAELIGKHYDEVRKSSKAKPLTASDNTTTRDAKVAMKNAGIAKYNGGYLDY
jgi:hypothetical protein